MDIPDAFFLSNIVTYNVRKWWKNYALELEIDLQNTTTYLILSKGFDNKRWGFFIRQSLLR